MTNGGSAVAEVKGEAGFKGAAAPFLVWPVSRREFYRTICVALAPALAWGIVLFGSRALGMVIVGMAEASAMYLLLKRVIRWERAQKLMWWHCLASALVIAGLAHPTWPVWMVGALAFLVPLVLTVVGGPGKERIHVAVALTLAAQYIFLPVLEKQLGIYVGTGDGIVARDRLVMGDVREQAGDFVESRVWPTSVELAGDDAVRYVPPAVAATEAMDEVASKLPAEGGTGAGVDVMNPRDMTLKRVLDRAFAYRLPRMELFMLGVAPNRVGAASPVALLLAGLYLAYRYILRPQSAGLFIVFFVGATALFMFTPAAVERSGLWVIWEVIKRFPGEMLTLFNYVWINSDVLFAGVVVLALPGTLPLTARGRRMFLLVAAVGAAALHRLDPGTPAATLALCIMMPVAGVFDRVLVQRSWVNEGNKEIRK